MAKMKRNIGDYVSGKLGNVVFVQMNGKSYVRSAPQRSINNWSSVQLMYRTRLKNISKIWNNIKTPEIKNIWDRAAGDFNCYALFIQYNIHALSIAGLLIDPKLLKVSAGSLPVPFFKSNPVMNKIAIFWQNDPNFKAERLNDRLLYMSYCNEKFSAITDLGVIRSDQGCVIDKPFADTDFGLGYLFLFFANDNNTLFSESTSFETN